MSQIFVGMDSVCPSIVCIWVDLLPHSVHLKGTESARTEEITVAHGSRTTLIINNVLYISVDDLCARPEGVCPGAWEYGNFSHKCRNLNSLYCFSLNPGT